MQVPETVKGNKPSPQNLSRLEFVSALGRLSPWIEVLHHIPEFALEGWYK